MIDKVKDVIRALDRVNPKCPCCNEGLDGTIRHDGFSGRIYTHVKGMYTYPCHNHEACYRDPRAVERNGFREVIDEAEYDFAMRLVNG